jgi:methylase of polypeptide subunit release factors
VTELGSLERLAVLDGPTCEALRTRLREAGWTLEFLGAAESVAPGVLDAVRLPLVESWCARRGGPGAVLARLLAYDLPVCRGEAEEALGGALLDRLEMAGLVAVAGERVQSCFRVLPFDDLYLVCDRPEAGPDSAMGAGPTTYALSRLVPPDAGKVLDLGCGAGALALHAARLGASRCVGVDLNHRAVALAAVNARLNGLATEFHAGDLTEPVRGERFDLVVAQPPYVPLPTGVPGATYLHGGAQPAALVVRFATGAAESLASGGRALLSIETPAGGAALHEEMVAALRDVPVDVVTISSPGMPLDLQAAAYASVVDVTLGEAYRAAARRYAEHLHGLGSEPTRALVVLRRRRDGRQRLVRHHRAPAVQRLTAPGLDAFLAGLDAATAPDAFLLGAEVRTAPRARLAEERSAGQPEEPPVRTVRFGGALAMGHEVGEAGAALLDILAGPGTVDHAVRRFAEACGETPAAVRDTVLGFVRQGLGLAMLEVKAIVR